MRMSELSAQSGVPVATIKFYARENLLPGGEKTSVNQASYGSAHLARLRLVRALVEVGGLSIANVRSVLTAIDDESRPVADAISAAACALPTTDREGRGADPTPGELAIDELIAERGWMVLPGSEGRDLAARVIDDYLDLGRPDLAALLGTYADAVQQIAEADIQSVAEAGSRAAMAETVIVGTVLGDALLAGLRRMAHSDVAYRRFHLPAARAAAAHPTTDPTSAATTQEDDR
jgi:DNA-binding transcriptional MerR regulator